MNGWWEVEGKLQLDRQARAQELAQATGQQD